MFLSHCSVEDGAVMINAFECVEDESQIKTPYVLEGKYKILGAPSLWKASELEEAESLNNNCLDCKYCRHHGTKLPMNSSATDVKSFCDHDVNGIEMLSCKLQERVVGYGPRDMTPRCEFKPIESILTTDADPPMKDIKGYFRDVISRHGRSCFETENGMPWEVFSKLLPELNIDSRIYFGTGSSFRDDRMGRCGHETVDDYLADPEPDANVICLFSKDVTEDIYLKLTKGYCMWNYCYDVICIPDIDFASFGNEELDQFRNGCVLYAPEHISKKLLEANIFHRE